MKIIETEYKGYKFRSRLEAKWAVYFDYLGVKWEYEPEGYELSDGTRYLPDFLLHGVMCRGKEIDLYVEVKGQLTEQDLEKVQKFAYGDTEPDNSCIINPILILGNIPEGETIEEIESSIYEAFEGSDNNLFSFRYVDMDCWPLFPAVKYNGKFGAFVQDGDDNMRFILSTDNERTERAYRAARQARFEHGECPVTVYEKDYRKNSMKYHLGIFRNKINGERENRKKSYIPTGFTYLDNALGGGLYKNLYVIGAVSSIGKTTLMLQIADQIAKSGTDVLIFALEMSSKELVSKSISRLTFQQVLNDDLLQSNAKTSIGIMDRARYKNYSTRELQIIENAWKEYEEYSRRIFITEGVSDTNIGQIRETVRNHILITDSTPVVFVDYLQIVDPTKKGITDKQNVDNVVMELKRMNRELEIPIVAISSLNRAGYDKEVTMGSFKESGAIEYSADVLIGLQYWGAGNKDFNMTEAAAGNIREIEAKILKNRFGRSGCKVQFDYYPKYNLFKEI